MSKRKVPDSIKVDLPTEAPKSLPRSFVEIQNQFTELCARAGHCQYQIVVNQKDLDVLNEQLRALNLEAAAAQVREAKEGSKPNE